MPVKKGGKQLQVIKISRRYL